VFERAYCFYRLKRYPEALKLVESHPQPKPTRVLELEAQVVSETYARPLTAGVVLRLCASGVRSTLSPCVRCRGTPWRTTTSASPSTSSW
jgi:hypothetical protein